MTEWPDLDPSPFLLEGGPVGCVLVHGFTSSPPEMRPLAEYLSQRGITVSAPLLAGHGSCLDDLEATHREDWHANVRTAYQDLKKRCSQVFVGGLSLGSLLAARLAAEQPVAGLIMMSPAVMSRDWRLGLLVSPLRYVLPRFIRSNAAPDFADPDAEKRLWTYEAYPREAIYQLGCLMREVRRRLPVIQAPALVIFGARDGVLNPNAGRWTYEHIGSDDKRLVTVEDSGHCLPLDAGREQVWRTVHEWIEEHSAHGA